MSFREFKAFTDIIGSIRDAANNATTEKSSRDLERCAVAIETRELEIARQHAEEVDNLKSRHSQAIEADRQKHIKAIGDLKSGSAKEIRTLTAQNAELELQLAAYRQQPSASFRQDIGTYFDESSGFHYCPRCWRKNRHSPMIEVNNLTTYAWQCSVCGSVSNDRTRAIDLAEYF